MDDKHYQMLFADKRKIRELEKEIHEIKNSLNIPVKNILTKNDTYDDNHDKDD